MERNTFGTRLADQFTILLNILKILKLLTDKKLGVHNSHSNNSYDRVSRRKNKTVCISSHQAHRIATEQHDQNRNYQTHRIYVGHRVKLKLLNINLLSYAFVKRRQHMRLWRPLNDY